MSAPVARLPPLPVFDPEKDGNPFRWIVAQAPMVRAQRQQVDHQARARNRQMLFLHSKPVRT